MLIILNDLPKNVSIFAEFCLKNYSFDDVILAAQNGINKTDCKLDMRYVHVHNDPS